MFCPGDKRRASHPQEFTQPFFFSQFIFVSRLTNLGNSNTYKHLRDAEKDDKDGSKPVAGHFNLLNHSTSRKHGKPQNSRTIFFFKSALLILTVSTNACQLIYFLVFYVTTVPTNSVVPSFCI